MAITITTLNNEAAAAKTFAEIAKDRMSAQWYNSTDWSNPATTLTIQQKVTGMDKPSGSPIQMSSVLVETRVPITVVVNGIEVTRHERFTCRVILTGVQVGNVTDTQKKDVVAYARNFLTGANALALVRGEV